MTESRNYANSAPSNHHQVKPKENPVKLNENQVKVNFTFEVPLTDALRENIGKGIYSPSKVSARFNKLVGEGLSSIASKDNSLFQGRFVVTDINDVIKGVYFSQSMIKLTTELNLLKELRESLEALADTSHVSAEITLNCCF